MLKKERKGLEEKKARSPPHSQKLKKSRTHRYFLLVKVGIEVQAVADGVQDWAEEVKYVRLNAHNVSKTTSKQVSMVAGWWMGGGKKIGHTPQPVTIAPVTGAQRTVSFSRSSVSRPSSPTEFVRLPHVSVYE